jgi:cytochrome c oxidase subunit IV
MAGIKLYVAIWAGLVAATIVEVLVRTLSGAVVFGVIITLLVIAAAKAVTIAMYYQHLRYETWRLAALPIAAVVGVTMLGISAAYSLSTGMW